MHEHFDKTNITRSTWYWLHFKGHEFKVTHSKVKVTATILAEAYWSTVCCHAIWFTVDWYGTTISIYSRCL